MKRIRIENYGPIPNLDIDLPFDDDRPKPVVLVGENGSGKSIVLSHIVNGMIEAKHVAYPQSRELDKDKVFKMRDGKYVAVGSDYCFGRVDFEQGQFIQELILRQRKERESSPPMQSGTPAHSLWKSAEVGRIDHYQTSFATSKSSTGRLVASELAAANCLLYFPPNRFEEPAWLNEDNLHAKPRHTPVTRLAGQTDRRILTYSPLLELQNWLFSVAYDRAAFEVRTVSAPVAVPGTESPVPLPLWLGYGGDATKVYELAVNVVKRVVQKSPPVSRLGIGGRHDRNLEVMSGNATAVPSVFQLASGETALLALFLSIMRDFDLREDRTVAFSGAADVRGLVVVDEVDLHLHARHQEEVLPELIRMFPRVQFVITTHSPLFVLGLDRVLGEKGFGLYELPSGSPIGPEEFGEFGAAYQAFRSTTSFRSDVRTQIEEAQRPILFAEGPTDCKYLLRAAELLEKQAVLDRFVVKPGGGSGGLRNLWTALERLSKAGAIRHMVILLHDPESNAGLRSHGKVHRRVMPQYSEHPITKGIEHLFERDTLKKARDHKSACIDIVDAHGSTVRGESRTVPEKWSVDPNEKTNLCEWLCENGSADDFRHFGKIVTMLEELLSEAEDHTEADGGEPPPRAKYEPDTPRSCHGPLPARKDRRVLGCDAGTANGVG